MKHTAFFGRGVGPIFISYMHCSRPQFSIFDCYIRHDHNVFSTPYYYYASQYFDIGVQCRGECHRQLRANVFICKLINLANLFLGTCQDSDIRLQGNNNPLIGRVEICINGTWGTICPHYHWTNKDASVVCRQLGYSGNGMIICFNHNS